MYGGEIIKLAANPKSIWKVRWDVPSESNPSKSYVVAQDGDGAFGCSCPRWIFGRHQCKHINRVAREIQTGRPALKATVIPYSSEPISLKELSRASFVEV